MYEQVEYVLHLHNSFFKLPFIVLTDVGEGADLHPGNVGVLVQHVDVVVRWDPND